MTLQTAKEQAYRLIAASMPVSWIEHKSDNRMTPKAIKLRDLLANAILKAFREGETNARR